MKNSLATSAFALCTLAAACGSQAPKGEITGPAKDITLPAPSGGLLPTLRMSRVIGWPAGKTPQAPAGFAVAAYGQGLKHPRWLYVLPNGDVLVAESATHDKPAGLKNWIENWLEHRAGAHAESADRLTLLRDKDGDGKVDEQSIFLSGLNQPFGMLLLNGWFYVANTDGVLRFRYTDGATRLDGPGEKILDLPAGGYNNHWTRNLFASADGKKIYVTVGSSTNIAEHGIAAEARRANVLEINPDGSGERVLASGLRNPNGLDFEPKTGALWTVVNERDGMGDNLVPDYLTRVEDGGFYGWPFSYWGAHVDGRIKTKDQRADLLAKALVPDYALGAHVASLGLVFYRGTSFPEAYRGGAFITEHGSWNRSVMSGYHVVYVPFTDGMPTGQPQVFLTGFLVNSKSEKAYGRPVGIAVDKAGALLVADDAGNTIWRVSPGR